MKKILTSILLLTMILSLAIPSGVTVSASQNVVFTGYIQYFQHEPSGMWISVLVLDKPMNFYYFPQYSSTNYATNVKEIQVSVGDYNEAYDNKKVVIKNYDRIIEGHSGFHFRDYVIVGADIELVPEEIKVSLNGNILKFDQNPVIVNNRTLVPVRAIFENLGCIVEWEGEHQKVSARRDNLQIGLHVGEEWIIVNDMNNFVNDNVISIDVAPILLNNRVLVPVRAIAESLGCTVSWDDATKTVFING